MADTQTPRIEREINALRNIGSNSDAQTKFIFDELRPNNQNQAPPTGDRIIVGRLLPKSDIYAQGSILIHIILKPTFPMEPPRVRVITKVYHPNVSEQGEICVDLLIPEASWTPATSLVSVIEKITETIDTPSLDKFQNAEAGKCYDANRQEYERIAKDTFNRNRAPRN